jgi:hypothetical protein
MHEGGAGGGVQLAGSAVLYSPPGQDHAASWRSLNQATVAAIASAMGVGAMPSRDCALAPSTTNGWVNS